MPIITVNGVGQDFENEGKTHTVLDNINLTLDNSIHPITMLMGASGCGKSTLMNMFGGVPPENVQYPTRGEVHIDGTITHGQHDSVVTVFQDRVNFPHLTVRENVAFPFSLRYWRRKLHEKGVTKEALNERIDSMLKAVELFDAADKKPQQLSGGMNQRLQLARAFVVRPEILLMDEPFSALDPTTRHEMQKLLLDLQSALGCMVVFVTHDIPEAMVLGHRILVLGGKPGNVQGDFNLITPQSERSTTWLREPEQIRMAGEIAAILGN